MGDIAMNTHNEKHGNLARILAALAFIATASMALADYTVEPGTPAMANKTGYFNSCVAYPVNPGIPNWPQACMDFYPKTPFTLLTVNAAPDNTFTVPKKARLYVPIFWIDPFPVDQDITQ
jgi:hypothetical protein